MHNRKAEATPVGNPDLQMVTGRGNMFVIF